MPVEDCKDKHARLELALFGPDGRAGMVADVAEIKTKLKAYTGILRSVVVPILVSVASALLIAWILRG